MYFTTLQKFSFTIFYRLAQKNQIFYLFIESISAELGGAISSKEALSIANRMLPEGRAAKGGIGGFLVEKPAGLTENFGKYIETYLSETEPLDQDETKAKAQLEGLLKPYLTKNIMNLLKNTPKYHLDC